MPFPMKVQPIDLNSLPQEREPTKFEPVKSVMKSRFKRLFERQFSSVLRISGADKPPSTGEPPNYCNKDGSEEFEPSSVCLGKMVQNFIEDNNEKPRCNTKRCNCFNGNCKDSSDEEQDSYNSSYSMDACEILKSLVPSLCVSERNLLADTARIVEKNKISKHKDGCCRKIVTDDLKALGYNASICKSKWEKSPSFPAGEYEYIDVTIESERFIIDIDFRSEFEIARSTKAYKLVLQTLPNIFVGKTDRLEKIIAIVSEAAKHSLKKKGMPFPPWRKADYVKAKWLSPYIRYNFPEFKKDADKEEGLMANQSSCDESELLIGEKCSPVEKNNNCDGVFALSKSSSSRPSEDCDKKSIIPIVKQWEPPEIKPKSLQKGVKIVAGLASIIEDKP